MKHLILLLLFSLTASALNETKTNSLKLQGSTSGYVEHKATATPTTYSLIWPAAQSVGSQTLQNDGSGNLSWATISSGANTALSNLTTTSINQDLLPSGVRNIGSAALPWNQIRASAVDGVARLEAGDIAVSYAEVLPTTTLPSGFVATGAFHAVSLANQSSPLGIYTDNDSAVNATATKDVHIETGNKTAGTGDSGSIVAKTGTSSGGVRGTFQVSPSIKYLGSTSGYVEVKSPAAPTSYSLTLPTAQGASDTFLRDDGSGVLSWTVPTGTGANTSLSNLTTTDINQTLQTADVVAAATDSNPLTLTTGSSLHGNSGDFTAFSGVATEGNSGAMLLYTSDNTATASTGDTGFTFLGSGSIPAAGSNGNTGSGNFATGNNNGTGATGNLDSRSGDQSGSTGNTGYAYYHSGTSSNSDSGIARLYTGGAANGTSGEADVFSGPGGATGLINITSGVASLTTSGPVTVQSGAANTDSGDVTVKSGTAGGIRGKVILDGRFIDASSKKISNVTNPTAAQDAATKNYVDSFPIVKLRAHNATATITGTDSKVTYSTEDYDSDSAYSTGTFTVPTGKAGNYHVGAQLIVTGTFVLNNYVQLAIYVNGSLYSRTAPKIFASASYEMVAINDEVQVTDGDTIEIDVSSDGTTPAINSSDSLNFVNIHKNGN